MIRRVFLAFMTLGLFAVSAQPAKPLLKKTPADKAVDKALDFLHKSQREDGSWSAGTHGSRHVAISSLSIMAFLSAGHVPGEGKYGKGIEKGIKWVLSTQKTSGLLANDGGHEMYHHGIATLMLAEVCGMVNEKFGKEIKKALEKAVALIVKAQRTNGVHAGGWRYRVQPVDGADISVTGWQVMALRAAKNLGCDVPVKTIEKAIAYINRCRDPISGGFRYLPGAAVTVPCTGTSILALELCGKDQHRSSNVLKATGYLIRSTNLPKWKGGHFFYSIYYGSQATFQVGGNYWTLYKSNLHKILLREQKKESGYWMGGGYDSNYGASYCTAMAVLALTVEYRYLPIYQRDESTKKDR